MYSLELAYSSAFLCKMCATVGTKASRLNKFVLMFGILALGCSCTACSSLGYASDRLANSDVNFMNDRHFRLLFLLIVLIVHIVVIAIDSLYYPEFFSFFQM